MSTFKAKRSPAKNAHCHQRQETRRAQGRKQNYARILETQKARKGCTVTEAKLFLAKHQGKDRAAECAKYKRFLDSGQEYPILSAEDRKFLEEHNADGERAHKTGKKVVGQIDEAAEELQEKQREAHYQRLSF